MDRAGDLRDRQVKAVAADVLRQVTRGHFDLGTERAGSGIHHAQEKGPRHHGPERNLVVAVVGPDREDLAPGDLDVAEVDEVRGARGQQINGGTKGHTAAVRELQLQGTAKDRGEVALGVEVADGCTGQWRQGHEIAGVAQVGRGRGKG